MPVSGVSMRPSQPHEGAPESSGESQNDFSADISVFVERELRKQRRIVAWVDALILLAMLALIASWLQRVLSD